MRPVEPDALLSGLGRRIAELRGARGWTQAELAEHAEISLRYVQSLEGGKKNISVKSLARFANALSCSVGAFFETPETTRSGRGRPPKS